MQSIGNIDTKNGKNKAGSKYSPKEINEKGMREL